MITKKQDMRRLFSEALIRSKLYKNNILVTKTEAFQWECPLSFYEIGHLFHKERFFWCNPLDETMVGIGIAQEWKEDIEKQWEKITEQMVTDEEEHVAPMIFGGLSFDPQKKHTPLWDGFAEQRFVLPTFLLKMDHQGISLTSNIMVTADDCIEDIMKKYESKRAHLIEKPLRKTEALSIASSEEVALEQWMDTVENIVACLKEDQAEKVVLAREWKLQLENNVDSLTILERLSEQQHTSYVFAFEIGEACFVGATPEQLMKKQGKICTSMCLAGSIRKGVTIEENTALTRQLLHDKKNRREHEVVVNMMRNVMKETCEEVEIPNEPTILEMKNISHLHTPVYGVSKDGVTLLQMVKQLHPTPALGGYPQEKALEMIRQYEPLDRGWYGAPIGWLDSEGNGEFAVAIRSGIVRGKEISLFAGCGIVTDSTVEEEYEETKVKFTPMMLALGQEGC